MKPAGSVRHKHLAVAAVLAGAAGLALIALGWWIVDWQHERGWGGLSDPRSWLGFVVRTLGYLAIGKVGFKVALGVVFVGVGMGVAWRRRRSDASDDGADKSQATG